MKSLKIFLLLFAAGRIKSIDKYNYLIGNRTRDLPPCSIVPQSNTLLKILEKSGT
jgi:hypothetical protein